MLGRPLGEGTLHLYWLIIVYCVFDFVFFLPMGGPGYHCIVVGFAAIAVLRSSWRLEFKILSLLALGVLYAGLPVLWMNMVPFDGDAKRPGIYRVGSGEGWITVKEEPFDWMGIFLIRSAAFALATMICGPVVWLEQRKRARALRDLIKSARQGA